MCSTTQQFSCEFCKYKTNREYNLTRHVSLKHNDSRQDFSCSYCHKTFTTQYSLHRHVNTYCNGLLNKNAPELQNVNFTQPSVLNTTCSSCQRVFSRPYFLKRHLEESRCKGSVNNLECPVCHKEFNTRQAKQKHMKSCYIPTDTGKETIHTTNNTTNIGGDVNHIQTQHNTTLHNNGINIQGDLIIYNDHLLIFNDDHIDKRELQRIFQGASVKTIQAIASYAIKLLENPTNRCVRKKHITNSYCEVHTGEGNWICRPDKKIVQRFSQDVASSANDKLYDYPEIGDQKVREEITSIASYDEEIEKNKELVRELRSVLVQVSRESEKE